MIDSHFVINEPANFQNICKVYSPTIRQVITEENFLVYRKLLTLSQEEIEDEYMEKEMELSNVLIKVRNEKSLIWIQQTA